jgi:hypothetical protein
MAAEPRIVTRDESQRVVYLFARGQARAVVLEERALHYDAFGPAREATTFQNFTRLCDDLRTNAPHARWLDATEVQVARSVADRARRGVSASGPLGSSSAAAATLVAFTIADAHRAGEL